MKKSEFYLKKEFLKAEISQQEKILEEKFYANINPQNIILKVLPAVLKRFLNFEGKKLSVSFAEKINEILINVLIEAQKLIGGVSHLTAMFRDFKSVLKEKKTENQEL